MKSLRKKGQQRKEGPSLSSGLHSHLQWPGEGGRAGEGVSKGVASKVRGSQKQVVSWKQREHALITILVPHPE